MKRDGGFASVEWILGVGVLVIPLAALVVGLPPMLQQKSMAESIAQEAARAIVMAPTWEGGVEDAEELVAAIAVGHGTSGDVSVDFTSDSGGLSRGGTVTVTVTVELPAVPVPVLGSLGTISYQAVHTERVDDYRSFPP